MEQKNAKKNGKPKPPERPDESARTGAFRGTGLWGVVLGGSSGFGLATAKRLARAGMNLVIGHKDPQGTVETVLEPEFRSIREEGVELVARNANLFDDDARADLFEEIEAKAGRGKVKLFMHSVAAGACKLLAEERGASRGEEAVRGLAEALRAQGLEADEEAVRRAVESAFHEKGCDAFHTVARSRIPHKDTYLDEKDLERTIYMMGYDYMIWGRELCARGLLADKARLIAMTSEGNAVAWKGYGAVSAAKASLEALCRQMAVELGPYGARCFLLQAGITDTPAGNGIPGFDLMKARARLRNPGGRLTRPEDVAEAVHAMCGPAFDWVNGTVLRVDGGEAVSGG